ncbi:hypothetical protein HYFRA_00009971 [Hymenoscyphus fraxineus]|uniref:C3H1-type domain-containing protein n=1 Tax=Hymenoscyphus fraxineus TaxID=746836 RepID=A0A9N9KSS2_9HELO|nr:hypothetical protein HYFRA_00009971 [Hymenoscyphus fraxineus]
MAPCIFFAKGNCEFGQKCHFDHDGAASQGSTSSSLPFRPKLPQDRRITSNGEESQRSTQITLQNKSKEQPTRKEREEARMLKGHGGFLKNLHVEGSVKDEQPVEMKNYQFVASYSWKDIEHPTIYVPGCPPKFIPTAAPFQMEPDNIRKPPCKRSPAAAVDPLFQSLLHMHPEFNMSSVDIATDRNSLRKLLGFSAGITDQWRLEVDMIDDTLFFSQWEEFRQRLINGQQDSGYGHSLEDNVTQKPTSMEDCMHYERVVQYELGGLRCLVRYEADAFIDTEESPDIDERTTDELLAPKPSKPVLKPPYKLVHVIPRGRLVDPTSMVEIKSHKTPKFNYSKALPQLWFAQTKFICAARHEDGLVSETLEVRDMSEELEKWRIQSQDNLKNMMKIIKEIKEITREFRKCTVIYRVVDGRKCLSVFQRRSEFAIRPKVVETFWGKKSGT